MNKIITLLFVVSILASCKKEEKEILFSFPLQDIDFEIPPTAGPLQVHYINFNNTVTNQEGLFETNGLQLSDAERIRPQAALMRALGSNIDYDFIEIMSVRICENDDTSENCGSEIFYREPVPLDVGSTLDLIPSNVNVKGFLSEEKVNIQVKLERLRDYAPQFVETRLSINFAVE